MKPAIMTEEDDVYVFFKDGKRFLMFGPREHSDINYTFDGKCFTGDWRKYGGYAIQTDMKKINEEGFEWFKKEGYDL